MQRVLLIDNNDSFTYNIVDYLRRINALTFDVIKSKDLDIKTTSDVDKLIISPGPGLPSDFPALFDLFEHNILTKPILGICLGHQALNNYLGGSLQQLKPVVHGQAHAVKVINNSPLFKDIPNAFRAGLYHSWAVNQATLPKELEILAISENDIIMAIKHKHFPVYGVQFHPESHITDHGFTLIKNFIEL